MPSSRWHAQLPKHAQLPNVCLGLQEDWSQKCIASAAFRSWAAFLPSFSGLTHIYPPGISKTFPVSSAKVSFQVLVQR